MPFNAGTFTTSYNWTNEAAAGNPIDPVKFTAEDNDFAAGLSLCILRDGTGAPTADISWNSKKITNLATPTNAADAATKAYVDALPSSGTYTGTLTGCATAPTDLISYSKVGNIVVINIPVGAGLIAVSNANTFTITGAPAAIRPAATTGFITVGGDISNNGGDDNATMHQVTMGSTGTLVFYRAGSPVGWTATGTKGIGLLGCSFAYSL